MGKLSLLNFRNLSYLNKKDIRVDQQKPVNEEEYMTMEEIFLFAGDTLPVRHLFWDYEYEITEQGQRTYDDAIKVIRKYPYFKRSIDHVPFSIFFFNSARLIFLLLVMGSFCLLINTLCTCLYSGRVRLRLRVSTARAS